MSLSVRRLWTVYSEDILGSVTEYHRSTRYRTELYFIVRSITEIELTINRYGIVEFNVPLDTI